MRETLDDLRAHLDARFGDYLVATPEGDVVLRAVIRLPKDARGEIESRLALMEESNTADTDTALGHMRDVLSIAANRPDALWAMIEADPEADALTTILFERWAKATQPGEASRSPR
ncbi:phage tail assembly protein [Allokutzneria sp. A3M-2-11 16]|uniref:phage tail assembly protein n=1 Tax=Allokutzneria sp. A3M-2-11 16 TaxID=2962043 RepID=UPI0020B84DA9|nr:phage tail assembly protein [Allokutzneria sp. A3M-2-11 16]MCP3801855.1 phage tail assembly protein [Allokutzneria sp. A3M-2-11 16]